MDPVFGPGSEKWGIKHKKQSKIAFFSKLLFKKNHEADFFSKIFFGENVAQEPAQLLAETWCPYLLWVSRNLPHKFEKLAHVTKSAKKKRHHMGNLAPLVPQKHRRDGLSRLGTSRNVQWSAEGVTNSLCSRAHNLVNLSNLR